MQAEALEKYVNNGIQPTENLPTPASCYINNDIFSTLIHTSKSQFR